MRRTTACGASRDTESMTAEGGQNSEETRRVPVYQDRRYTPPVSDTLCTYEG